MTKIAEQIKESRQKVINKKKQLEEIRFENEKKNAILFEIDQAVNKYMRAVEKYNGDKELSPEEQEIINRDYIQLHIIVDEKYFKDIEEGYGLYPYNTTKINSNTLADTRLYFDKISNNCIKNEGLKETKTYDKESDPNNTIKIEYTNNNGEDKLKINGEEKDIKDFGFIGDELIKVIGDVNLWDKLF